jgi:hypothetical protein
MKLRVHKDIYVESRTFMRVEWRTFYPVLVIHERFEKHLKWTLRAIAFIGIATSVISIDKWYYSLAFAILIFLIEQFFERTIIEYTTLLFQPPPTFQLDPAQWKQNGFAFPHDKSSGDLPCFGPAYVDKDYAIRFFTYLRSWIDGGGNDDVKNNIVVSIVIEPNAKYTTYIYANLGRERLKHQFKRLGDQNKLEKYGKQQQQFFQQMFYWHTLAYSDELLIKRFLNFQKPDQPFLFAPTVLATPTQRSNLLFEMAIKKYEYKLKQRHEILQHEPEHLFNPETYDNLWK